MVTGFGQFNRPVHVDQIGPDRMHAVLTGCVHIFQRVISHMYGLAGTNAGGT